jgi:hypothetical protein
MSTSSSRKEKRQYKKRKHKPQREIIKPGLANDFPHRQRLVSHAPPRSDILADSYEGLFSSDDEDMSTQLGVSESEDEGIYLFRRNRSCTYFKVSIKISFFHVCSFNSIK